MVKPPLGGRPSKEYLITIDMAKQLSMIERTDNLIYQTASYKNYNESIPIN